MNQNCIKLDINKKDIFLIGTAHVSKLSAIEVEEVINEVNPDSICIELDSERYKSLQNPEKFKNQDIAEVIKNNKVGFLLVNIILSSFQKRIAKSMDSNSGAEMIQGIKSSQEKNINLELVDRNIQTTFSRIWRKHSFLQKCKLLIQLVLSIFEDEEVSEADLENLKQAEMLDVALQEVSKNFPIVKEVLVDERDKYLAYKIKNAKGSKIVAVVGAAHIPGIKKYIFEDYSIDELDCIPKKKLSSKLIGWIIPAFIISIIAYTLFSNLTLGLNQIKTWFLWNGLLSALGVLLSSGHIISILVAFFLAPFTSLNPLLAAGWFAGLSEAYLRKPQVKDFENLSSDVSSFKGFYHNKVTHILLVVIMANLFSTIGTIIGGIDIVKTFIEAL